MDIDVDLTTTAGVALGTAQVGFVLAAQAFEKGHPVQPFGTGWTIDAAVVLADEFPLAVAA